MDKEKREFIKEIVNREEIEEEKRKEKKEKRKKSKLSLIIEIIVWIVIIVWLSVCLFDFFRVKNEKDPVFCMKKGTNTYEKGKVDYCVGYGYKVYNYYLEDLKGYEFGPFWIKEKK